MPYEYHNFADLNLHKDRLKKNVKFNVHWHENPEILYFIDGSALVRSDETEIEANEGDIIIIRNNHIHSVLPLSDVCEYYCMIPDSSFKKMVGNIPEKTQDPEIIELYKKIIENYTERPEYSDQAIKGYLTVMFSLLSRNYSSEAKSESHNANPKLEAVKRTISFITENFQKEISVDDICKAVGLSKYYLCHIFKEITGQTILKHLNYTRCRHARFLLHSGDYTVSQSALMSGFSNMSYFTKVYTSVFGKKPSLHLIPNNSELRKK